MRSCESLIRRLKVLSFSTPKVFSKKKFTTKWFVVVTFSFEHEIEKWKKCGRVILKKGFSLSNNRWYQKHGNTSETVSHLSQHFFLLLLLHKFSFSFLALSLSWKPVILHFWWKAQKNFPLSSMERNMKITIKTCEWMKICSVISSLSIGSDVKRKRSRKQL